ncbi:RadC family protein [Haloimpatiens lingqiaonensis]|uniref:RadC family protein n=1 Tax=Haloimpatiens lingqiaonensis TaxID=1380675 RepID=UPI001FAAF26A|nr:DNA repair protein RadC [Haloimpatiens lingqiaonensis]
MNVSLKIMDLPKNERPRERLLRYGPEALSNAELLAVILRTGCKSENIITLSNRILKDGNGLNGLLNMDAEECMKIKGIGKAKASQILALAEISRRFKAYKSGEEYKITSPRDVANLLMEDMRYLKKEYLKIIMLNVKNIVLGVKDVSVGSLNSSIVHPREIFTEAIKKHSASIILCHNHPSGDPSPSGEDINVTRRIKECSKILGIDFLDHIVIGNGTYISLKEKGIM